MIAAYYNELDPYAAQWLRNLMASGHVPPGEVDERSIADVSPDDLKGFTQCHFFAGIAGWSLALRLAGWPDDRPVWTGSCPCQPFSAAGKGKAADDERHLWPEWFRLIRAVRPPIIFGEQVEAAIGWGWLDLIHADMEPEGYTIRSAVLPACSIGAPHIRNRVWFVADADEGRSWRDAGTVSRTQGAAERRVRREPDGLELGGAACELAHASSARTIGILGEEGSARCARWPESERGREDGGMDNAESLRRGEWQYAGSLSGASEAQSEYDTGNAARLIGASATRPWSDCDWLPCTDGKARPVEPGTFPLAHGIPGRVGRLRAYGNAITPQVAAEFIAASVSFPAHAHARHLAGHPPTMPGLSPQPSSSLTAAEPRPSRFPTPPTTPTGPHLLQGE